ncbi:hypothetical protein CBER1_02579 [Cercospora berteroae]|uniref:Uncharacterized protein n=1 Tax=Cercospora berteroae TaxID=357750 RepID=A0A2S6CEM5_9PEZI|nr:hypothetical protein CBER1_02579 [Cercospora berteroae]
MSSKLLMFTALAGLTLAQSTTEAINASTTVDLLLGTLTSGFSGSVQTAAPCETVYLLTCSGQPICPDPVTLTATQGPQHYIYNFQNSVSDSKGEGTVTASQSCSLQNANTAVCNQYESISFGGRSSTIRRQTTLSGADLVYANVGITGGVERLAEATGECSTATAFPSRTGVSGGAAKPTSVVEVVKVVVPVGIAVAGIFL